MRRARVLVAAALLFALSGCVPSGTGASVSPSPRSTPVFASEAEALAAAEKAYAEYLRVSAAIAADGGGGPHRIDTLVTPEQAKREYATYAYFTSSAIHTSGLPTFGALKLEQLVNEGAGDVRISFYVCVDAAAVRVLDASGEDVTPVDRPDVAPLEVSMQSVGAGSTQLLLSESATWSGPGVC